MNQGGRGGPPRGPRGTIRGGPRGGSRSGSHSRLQRHSSDGYSAWPEDGQMNGTGGLKGDLVDICVQGWSKSKAANSIDRGIGELRKFLERKASRPNATPVEITEACRVLLDNVLRLANRCPGKPQGRYLHYISTTRAGGKHATSRWLFIRGGTSYRQPLVQQPNTRTEDITF